MSRRNQRRLSFGAAFDEDEWAAAVEEAQEEVVRNEIYTHASPTARTLPTPHMLRAWGIPRESAPGWAQGATQTKGRF